MITIKTNSAQLYVLQRHQSSEYSCKKNWKQGTVLTQNQKIWTCHPSALFAPNKIQFNQSPAEVAYLGSTSMEKPGLGFYKHFIKHRSILQPPLVWHARRKPSVIAAKEWYWSLLF